jgi:hypothetical protein
MPDTDFTILFHSVEDCKEKFADLLMSLASKCIEGSKDEKLLLESYHFVLDVPDVVFKDALDEM